VRRRTIVLVLGLLVLAGAGYLVYRSVFGQPQPEPLPTMVVEAVYPGADARVVADTVAAPVEQQVSGTAGVLHLHSQSASNGTYTLSITFNRGTDLDAAEALVRARLDLARPNLPAVVQQSGFTIRKEVPGAQLIVTLSSPDGHYDGLHLSNYADTELKEQLAGQAGVARVRLVGHPDNGFATLGGKPVVALVISRTPGTRPRDVSAAVQTRLTELRAALPEGMALELAFDPTPGPGAAEYLGSIVMLPDSAATERTRDVVRRTEGDLTGEVGGVRDVLALSENPFDLSPPLSNKAFLLIRLDPAGKGRPDRESIMKSIRGVFSRFPEARLLVRDLAAPGALFGGGSPVRLAVHSAADLGVNQLQATADALVGQLNRNPRLNDVSTPFRANVPSLRLEIDRKEAARLGVAMDRIEEALRSATVRGQPGSPGRAEELLRSLHVPDGQGKMVPLASVVRMTYGSGPVVIDRLDLEAMAEITANLAPGVSPAEARALCEEEARTTLPKEYRLTWLSEVPSAREVR
jgi:multidrug efflux pump subunit AcrB